VGPRAGLGGIRPPGPYSPRRVVYRLSYPGPPDDLSQFTLLYCQSLLYTVLVDYKVEVKNINTTLSMYVQRNVGARSHNHCCSGKAISVTYCECVFVSSMQRACACVMLCSVACPAVLYFFTLSHKRQDFRGGGGSYRT
jgi:hypothetical protein